MTSTETSGQAERSCPSCQGRGWKLVTTRGEVAVSRLGDPDTTEPQSDCVRRGGTGVAT